MTAQMDLQRVRSLLATAAADWTLHLFDEVGSTMDIARELAGKGAPAWTAVLAESQSAGRGRLGRRWLSNPGDNIYVTAVLRPSLLVLRRLAMVTPLAVATAIEETTGLQAGIKWPNDVQIAGRKVSGVLIDAEVRGDEPAVAYVGIGLNVNADLSVVPELRDIATSLRTAGGTPVERERVLAVLLARLRTMCEGISADDGLSVFSAWRRRLVTLGQHITVRGAGWVEAGYVVDVTEEGSLCLQRQDGSLAVIAAGEVTLREQ